MNSLWEGQAGAAEKNIFLVCYNNQVAEHVCLHASKTSYLLTALLHVEIISYRSSFCFLPTLFLYPLNQFFAVFFFPV